LTKSQNEITDHLREYIVEMKDEARWDDLFAKSQDKLAAAARQAKKEIAEGKASPMDYDAL
jgi:hypothetical protein